MSYEKLHLLQATMKGFDKETGRYTNQESRDLHIGQNIPFSGIDIRFDPSPPIVDPSPTDSGPVIYLSIPESDAGTNRQAPNLEIVVKREDENLERIKSLDVLKEPGDFFYFAGLNNIELLQICLPDAQGGKPPVILELSLATKIGEGGESLLL